MSLAAPLLNLGRRFDRLALRPPDDAAAPVAGHDLARAALQAWCGPGEAPGARAADGGPAGERPPSHPRLAVGALCGADAARTRAWADGFARQLDGSLRLAALPGRAAGLAWRLQVKLHDAMLWRPRQPGDPWDAGWAVDTEPARHQLGSRFRPRRATLVLADTRQLSRLQPVLTALDRRQRGVHPPLRWLWVGSSDEVPPAPDGLAMARFMLD